MWKVITVETFDQWFLNLNQAEQTSVLASIFKLEEFGPLLGRLDVDTLTGSKKVKNLKELRVQHQGRPYRLFFAFDPLRQAVLLCGGDKTGDKRFYKQMIPLAEAEFLIYLKEMES